MHSQINKLFKILFISALALASLNSYAENSKEFGDYVIHYNAFRSDTISPEIAKQYGLARANNRVLINIAILKKVLNNLLVKLFVTPKILERILTLNEVHFQ